MVLSFRRRFTGQTRLYLVKALALFEAAKRRRHAIWAAWHLWPKVLPDK